VPALRCAGGGLSLGRAVGASDDGVGQRRGDAGARTELAGHGARIRAELQERGDDREARRPVRP
jgi:hypothetical protein